MDGNFRGIFNCCERGNNGGRGILITPVVKNEKRAEGRVKNEKKKISIYRYFKPPFTR